MALLAIGFLQVLIIGFASLFLLLRWIGKSKKQDNLPPEPPSWPVIGHLPIFAASSHPHRELHRLSEQYGPILYLRLGGRPCVVVSSKELAREVLKTQDLNFASRPHHSAFDHMGFKEGAMGMALYGPLWRYLRKVASLELLTHKRVQEFEGVRNQEMAGLVRSIYEEAAASEEAKRVGVNLYEKAQLSVHESHDQSGDGKAFLPCGTCHRHRPEAAEFKELIKELDKAYGVQFVGDHNPYLAFLDWIPKRQLQKLHAKLDRFLSNVLDEHRKQNKGQPKPEVEQDFMDVLLTLQDEEGKPLSDNMIKGQALTMLNAGVDAATIAVEWALAEVIRDPRILELVQKELDSVVGKERRVQESDIAQLPYLQAIVKETFRLHPVSGLLLPHCSIESCQLGGYDIPAGITVFVSSWSLGRRSA